MNTYQYTQLPRIISKCLKDIAIFQRNGADGDYLESNDVEKEGKRWVVIAAGLDEQKAQHYFSGSPKRMEKAMLPLCCKEKCKLSIFLILKPCFGNGESISNSEFLVPFARSSGVEHVEIREGQIKIWDIADNNQNINSMRIDWDLPPSLDDPYEHWMLTWKDECGFNPAHPPTHLHINSTPDEVTVRRGDRIDDLRLSLGKPNPLAILLSISSWINNLRI